MCFINTSLFHLAHLITKISQGMAILRSSYLWMSGGLSNNNLSDFRNSKARACAFCSGHTAGDDASLTGLARELAHSSGGNVGISALHEGIGALRLSPCQSAFEDSMWRRTVSESLSAEVVPGLHCGGTQLKGILKGLAVDAF